MQDLTFFLSVWFGSLIATYFIWFICHYNGRIIFSLIPCLTNNKSRQLMPSICLVGAMPLALLSIITAALNTCFNSFYAFLILELFLTIIFLFLSKSIKTQSNLLGFNYFRNNLVLVISVIIWCTVFALWGAFNHKPSLDYMILNTNPDMWAYVRRIAAFTTNNLNFYGLTDGFSFDGNSACAYLLGSPKKFSSFLASLISYPFLGSSLGIAVFQGMLGSILFICLFKNWCQVNWSKQPWGRVLLVTWAIFSPPLVWFAVSAYFSNALFVIVVCLTLRHCREFSLNNWLDTAENYLTLLAILIITFAFYPAFLPIIIACYMISLLIYQEEFNLKLLISFMVKTLTIIIVVKVLFYLIFASQLGLKEVSKSFNLLDRHGSNFVPLNPWSLLQEKPKPMGLERDFGWYFNIAISLPFSLWLGWKILEKYRNTPASITRLDLRATLAGISLYIGYLLAYIALEHTYRLMKIATSLLYPLAIFGLLPLIIWMVSQMSKQAPWKRYIILALAIGHVIWHIEAVFDLETFPSGNLSWQGQERLEQVKSIVVVGCPDVHESQFFERLVGLQIARRYPHLTVNVVNAPASLDDNIQGDLFIYGEAKPEATSGHNTCHFSIS